jgi:tRNA (guanine-N7-)-methyltransferase
VEDLHNWHMEKCFSHPLFRELSQEEMEDDPSMNAMINETEEGKKVERSGAKKHHSIFEHVNNSDHLVSTVKDFFDKSHFGVMHERNKDNKKKMKEDEDRFA